MTYTLLYIYLKITRAFNATTEQINPVVCAALFLQIKTSAFIKTYTVLSSFFISQYPPQSL